MRGTVNEIAPVKKGDTHWGGEEGLPTLEGKLQV
jgi:hypothetical protein